ncbi:biosynthesis protein PigD [Pseudoalteromonas denitrificans]|uniref:Acetolactate synthase large subunit n=1 Tax=Pseudoalteromonas denitrificans DSM 6059 TaxID=1123010 RepID=A0A1I1G1I8_9GAMM|nr:biosynthesis protein PigD [Pseudoalteromonas denitrificans]SFC05607.1 Acetolactate synthase large subunit [Pseudoalteromonas denitrificans DSM 6059]
MKITVGIVVVTKNPDFFETGLSVLSDIKEYVFNQVNVDADINIEVKNAVSDQLYLETKLKAINYLQSKNKTIDISVFQSESLEGAAKKIIQSQTLEDEGECHVGMVYYDQASMGHQDDSIEKVDYDLLTFYRSLKSAEIPAFYSSFSAAVFLKGHHKSIRYLPQQFIEQVRSEDLSTFQTQLLCLWMDFFEMNYANRRIKPLGEVFHNNTLGEQLIRFFNHVSPNKWNMSYYTGSVISNLIGYIDREAPKNGGLVLRGPCEHALACGAMANWQLYKTPFLLVVTSGMVDEFKGTLANLKEAAAKGFIVVAENKPSHWYSFQGTITPSEDTRAVLDAKRINYVYMEDTDQINNDLNNAFELYHKDEGPVVLLVTPNVLDASKPVNELAEKIVYEKMEDHSKSVSDEAELAKQLNAALELVNNGPEKIVWQLGPLDDDESLLVQSIAHEAGIALVDSLPYPGSVSKYINGKRNINYLGTLSIYGFSPRVYNYLYTHDKLNPPEEQCLFFVKSRVSQICSPFTEGRLNNKLNIVQVTHNPIHIAPFSDIGLQMDSKTFLKFIKENLKVSPELKKRRMSLINGYFDSQSDVISKLPSTPMSPNYFFSEFNQVIEKLIIKQNFDYTGIYDVGRCGISAIRNVATTRRGFSGWYGRALMGDALLSSIFLAHTCPTNIIAFIGDGAKGMVPDIYPSFIENLLTHPENLNKNITIMFFCNGGLSVINTYQERILMNRTSKQMRLINLHQDEWQDTVNNFDVVSKTITKFDATEMEAALTAPRRLNLFSVVVNHNNEGDGITLATAKGWQRDPVLTEEIKEQFPWNVTEPTEQPITES